MAKKRTATAAGSAIHSARPSSYSSTMAVATMVNGPDEPVSEVDRVKSGVLEMIRNREILPGQRLDQRRLAKQLDSTTAPLREALSSLEAQHVLVRERGLGFFCRAYTVDEIEDLIEIRGVLEGLAARRAALHVTSADIKELMRMAKDLERPFPPERESWYVDTHICFHELVVDLARSSMLSSMVHNYYLIESFIGNIGPSVWRVEPHDHHTVVEAIASGDPEKAQAAMQIHIAPPAASERISNLRKIYGMGPILSPVDRFSPMNREYRSRS